MTLARFVSRHIGGALLSFVVLGGGIAFAHNGVDHSKPQPDAVSGMAMASPAASDPAESENLAHEQPFLQGNEAAMTKMMAGMNVQATGDIDRDFVAMMAPHHQGAIDMCVAFLPYAQNPQLKRLCQEIIVTQQQEIAAMFLAIGKDLPPSTPAPTR
ncbi:DUF305 domain-containing protein [Thalassospira mesophila]|uniref:DUF305 domain-containing protein n=1 Tax=Thalassospira mesophila TaxID=1293891 RepID=UPI001B804028|nr:DUF305 domain-containing protein [Thalassospira mesophila]